MIELCREQRLLLHTLDKRSLFYHRLGINEDLDLDLDHDDDDFMRSRTPN